MVGLKQTQDFHSEVASEFFDYTYWGIADHQLIQVCRIKDVKQLNISSGLIFNFIFDTTVLMLWLGLQKTPG